MRLGAADTLVESISNAAPLVNGIDDEKYVYVIVVLEFGADYFEGF